VGRRKKWVVCLRDDSKIMLVTHCQAQIGLDRGACKGCKVLQDTPEGGHKSSKANSG
jgi:hypothetical protein